MNLATPRLLPFYLLLFMLVAALIPLRAVAQPYPVQVRSTSEAGSGAAAGVRARTL